MNRVLTFLKDFVMGMGAEYKEAWVEHSATLFWTGVICFVLGAVIL